MEKFLNQTNHKSGIYIAVLLGLSYVFNMIDYETFYSLFVLKSNTWGKFDFWQFLTYTFFIGESNIFFAFINVIFFFWISSSLEQVWGTYKFLLFILLTVLLKSITAFIFGVLPMISGYHLMQTLLIAYAFNFSERTIYVFFFIPIKVKYIGYITLATSIIAVITGFFFQYTNIPFVRYISICPSALAGFLTTFAGYLPLLIFFKDVFAINKPIIVIRNTKLKKIANEIKKNNPFIENNNITKNKLDIIITDKEIKLCPPIDFEQESNYCKNCEAYSKCLDRSKGQTL